MLHNWLGDDLHLCVQRHIKDNDERNAFKSLCSTQNTQYLHYFLQMFRREGQLFVEHFAPKMRTSEYERDYEMQQLFAFVKTWCF